ncbi:glycosyltransferase [Nordella sp. HKS 07]|uniref:glycosyltransferase n=1 Tax=Nordella sp. HKS 07 TaxID=2712222 RepID=UPI001FF04498|nr:glycosyltransferase [Nordella sp. HKS 07]
MTLPIFIGWDPRESDAYDVCAHSLRRYSNATLAIYPIKLSVLREAGLYTRATEIREGRLWDVISEAPMSTEFAISRFFVPIMADRAKFNAEWALFCDCDFLWTGDVAELFAEADSSKALCCVKHQYEPKESVKMDGQIQLLYARKNWSSMMLFNLKHPANNKLSVDLLNGVPGRDLHRFCWLEDNQIKGVSSDWNWLEGTYPRMEPPPRAVHFTRGGPWMAGWEHVEFGDLWLKEYAAFKAQC